MVPTDITEEISAAARELYRENYQGMSVRLLGIRATDLSGNEFAQMGLFDQKRREKLEKLDASIDRIREKYGENAILRASFLEKKCNGK